MCIPGYGKAPFCKGKDSLSLTTDSAALRIPYAKLKPCTLEEEDQAPYGLQNKKSQWQEYAVEIHSDSTSGFVGYKHAEVSKRMNGPKCIGDTVYGSSIFDNDLFLHKAPPKGKISDEMAQKLRQGQLGKKLSQEIKGDFVFLFDCPRNTIADLMTALEASVLDRNKDGMTENGLVNAGEVLGATEPFGSPKWSKPHICGKNTEPNEKGECRLVKECIYDKGGCKEYDEGSCTKNEDCISGYCSTDDKKCGIVSLPLFWESLQTRFCLLYSLCFALKSPTMGTLVLPRSVPYGLEQGDSGNLLVSEKGAKVSLFGDTWKAFKLPAVHTVKRETVFEFEFQLDKVAEGMRFLCCQ